MQLRWNIFFLLMSRAFHPFFILVHTFSFWNTLHALALAWVLRYK